MKRAVTYHRVSTVDQNPALARQELRGAAAARGLEVLEEVEETGSGHRSDRPGLARVLELVRRGQVVYVLVWKLDRLGRSVLDVLATIEELTRCGVTFVAVTQGIEVGPASGPMGRLVLQLLSAIAEFERELIRERTRLGLEGARARGVRLGRAPRLEADQVALALELRAQGASYRAIGRQLAPDDPIDPAIVRRACEKGGQPSVAIPVEEPDQKPPVRK